MRQTRSPGRRDSETAAMMPESRGSRATATHEAPYPMLETTSATAPATRQLRAPNRRQRVGPSWTYASAQSRKSTAPPTALAAESATSRARGIPGSTARQGRASVPTAHSAMEPTHSARCEETGPSLRPRAVTATKRPMSPTRMP